MQHPTRLITFSHSLVNNEEKQTLVMYLPRTHVYKFFLTRTTQVRSYNRSRICLHRITEIEPDTAYKIQLWQTASNQIPQTLPSMSQHHNETRCCTARTYSYSKSCLIAQSEIYRGLAHGVVLCGIYIRVLIWSGPMFSASGVVLYDIGMSSLVPQ